MRSPTSYTLLIALISLLFISASSYTFNPPIGQANQPTYLVDLLPWQYDIMGNAQSWDVDYTISSDGSRTTSCESGVYVLGGPKMFSNHTILERTYTQLPGHNYVYYLIAVYAIDNWGSTDSITFRFDDYTSATWYPYTYRTTYGANYCGGTATDLLIWYAGAVPHSGDSLTVTIIADMKSVSNDSPGVGFHTFSLSFPSTGSITGPLAYACPKGQCDFGAKVCPQGQFYDGTLCSACDSSCASCWGSKASECFSCQSGYSYNGVSCVKCSASNCRQCAFSPTEVCTKCNSPYYLDSDGKCKTACSNALAWVLSPSGATTKYCFEPCPDGYYLWWNGTCLPSSSCVAPPFGWYWTSDKGGTCTYGCDPYNYYYSYPDGQCLPTCPYYPRVENGYRFCDYCAESSQYVYYYADYSCSSTCEENYYSYSYGLMNYCFFTCLLYGTPDYYLYQNGSCYETCETNFVATVRYTTNKHCDYPCKISEYLYQNGTCGSFCEAHFDTRIEFTDKQFCDFPCQSGEYLYRNGTCASSCETPFKERIFHLDLKYCDFPCTSLQYLYQNGSCLSYCQQYFASFTEGTDFNYCNYPCAATEYLYQNGSCLATCNAGYVKRYEGQSYWFCDEACPSPNWMYQNGSCLSTCQTHYIQRTETGPSYFCDFPCFTGEYLFGNGSCSESCPSSYLSTTQDDLNFCTFPCNSGEYYNQDGSCSSTCSSGYSFADDSNNFCWQCPTGYHYYSDQETCLTDCPYPYTVEAHSNCAISQSSTDQKNTEILSKLINVSTQLVTGSASFLTFFIWYNPSSFLLLALIKLFYYMKHMKIPYSALLQSVLDKLSLEYTYTMFNGSAPDSFSEDTPLGHLPYNFLKYNMHSSFFVNFFTPLVWLIIIQVFIGVIHICKWHYRKNKNSQILLDRVKNILKWNFTLAWFFDLYDGIIIYSSLSWRATTWSSGSAIWSFVLATFFFVLALVVLAKSIKIVHQLHKILQSNFRKNTLQKLLQDFREKTTAEQIIYEEAKDDSIFTVMLFPIYIIRIILFHIIIGYLFDHPRAQTPLLLFINATMLFYLIKFKPLKEKRKQIQYVLIESVLFFNYLLVFILSLPLGSGGPSESTRNALGYIILCLYILTVLTVLLYLAIQCFVKFKELLKYFKTSKNNKRVQPEEPPTSYHHPSQRGLQRGSHLGGDSPGEENASFEVRDISPHNSRRKLQPENSGLEMEMSQLDKSIEKERAKRAREKAARIRGSNRRETAPSVSWKS